MCISSFFLFLFRRQEEEERRIAEELRKAEEEAKRAEEEAKQAEEAGQEANDGQLNEGRLQRKHDMRLLSFFL